MGDYQVAGKDSEYQQSPVDAHPQQPLAPQPQQYPPQHPPQPQYQPYAQQQQQYGGYGAAPVYDGSPYGQPQQPVPVMFAVLGNQSPDVMWLFPVGLLLIGLICMCFFPILTPVFWLLGALFVFYPQTYTRVAGAVNLIPLLLFVLLCLLSIVCCCCYLFIAIIMSGAGAASN